MDPAAYSKALREDILQLSVVCVLGEKWTVAGTLNTTMPYILFCHSMF